MTVFYVLRREARAFLFSPYTYAIGAAYLIISGIFFVNILISSEVPDLEAYYGNIAGTLLVLVPIVAMRSFAEERRTGALDITLAWPGSRTGTVLGKFIANTLYLWVLSSIIWVYYSLVGAVAKIEVGRTAGGFVGLLLMAMGFSALALMVSAWTKSPAAAAFVGFGLLLFLWILEFAPGWIGSVLEGLGPAAHFKAFPDGAIYWEDVAYFVLMTLVGIGLAVYALDRDRPGRKLGSGLLYRGAALAAVAVLGTGSVALAGDVEGNLDLTASKQNTLTETTRTVIDRVDQKIDVTGFAEPISKDADKLRLLVKQYRSAGADISLEIVDPDVQPGTARAAGAVGYGEILVKVGSRRETLRDIDQGTFTSAVLRLSRATKPRACFSAGHGERDIEDRTEIGFTTFANLLRYSFEVKRLALGAPGGDDELDDCAVVIVAGPRVAFLPAEIDLLSAHAAEEGRLLLLADAVATEPNRQLNEFLLPWGVQFGEGIVRDASALADDPSSIVSFDYPSGASPPVRQLVIQEVPVVLTNSLPIRYSVEAEENNAFVPLVESSPKSWITDESGERVNDQGPFALAALADWQRLAGTEAEPDVARTRIGVVGGVDMFTNRIIDLLGNRQFATALSQWVAQEDDLISAGRPLEGFQKVVLTARQKSRLINRGIVLPTAALIVPLPLVALRLKRG